MVSLTLSVDSNFKNKLKYFSWINWSEIAREETMKKIIFEKYINGIKIKNKEWDFCEKNDWHPVDELPLKSEYVKKLERVKKEKSIKIDSVSDIFK